MTTEIKRVQSRRKTIACSFCVGMSDDVCIAQDTGVAICMACLKFATDEVATAQKTQKLATDLGEIVTKLTVSAEQKSPEVDHASIIASIKAIMDSHEPESA